jgi:type VI protein secretion system component Hcp
MQAKYEATHPERTLPRRQGSAYRFGRMGLAGGVAMPLRAGFLSFEGPGAPKGAATSQSGETGLFEIEDYSFDIEQVLNIGSQSSGAGAGKVTFNPFQITRKTDVASPNLFRMCATGQSFPVVVLHLRRASSVFIRFELSDCAISGYHAGPHATESFTLSPAAAEFARARHH